MTIGDFVENMEKVNREYFDLQQMLRMGNKIEYLTEIQKTMLLDHECSPLRDLASINYDTASRFNINKTIKKAKNNRESMSTNKKNLDIAAMAALADVSTG